MDTKKPTEGKTLYFENLGCATFDKIGIYHLRTAFSNDNSKQIFLELLGCNTNKKLKQIYPSLTNVGYVDFCFCITDDTQSIIKNVQHTTFEYTHANILQLVNKTLDCSFEKICVLNDSAEYRACDIEGNYNLIDNLLENK